jgi:hypothetical protein
MVVSDNEVIPSEVPQEERLPREAVVKEMQRCGLGHGFSALPIDDALTIGA